MRISWTIPKHRVYDENPVQIYLPHFISMIPYLSTSEVNQALAYPNLIKALAKAFTEEIQTPQRHAHQLSDIANSSLLLMPAWQSNAHAGVKLVTVAPKNQGLPSVHAIFVLFDSVTGAPLALMDGEALTVRRTAAASALASGYLSRIQSEHLLLVGNGALAPHLAIAHSVTRPIKRISVWGRSADKSQRCIDSIRMHPEFRPEIQIDIVDDIQAACANADIIACATTSQTPIVHGNWIKAGTHLDLVGGFKPDMREVDDELMSKATVFVDTFAGALAEAGDLVQPLENGKLARTAIVAELAGLCQQHHDGRKSQEEITVFKSVGTALEDLCAANLVWSRHQAR